MEKSTTKQSQKFVKQFALTSAILLAIIAGTIYIVDPFFQYRTRDKQYILNPIYANPGIARNYDYNTVIIGSSMVQNYDLSILEKDSVTRPVKLASGAITIRETKLLYNLSNKEKTNTYIINLDMIQFNEWMAPFRYPTYLFEGGFMNKLRYHFAYESVVRYGLTDMVMYPYMALTDAKDRPLKVKLRTTIEDIGNFTQEAIYNDKERIIEMYHSGETVSMPQTYQMNYRMKLNIDDLLSSLEFEKYPDKEFIFVLPPYSALYWHITQQGEYYYHLRNNIKYLSRETAKFGNVHIQCFYNLEQITDLNRYSDVTHFDPTTSNYILENMKNTEYTLTKENMNSFLNKLDQTIIKFREQNADWL